MDTVRISAFSILVALLFATPAAAREPVTVNLVCKTPYGRVHNVQVWTFVVQPGEKTVRWADFDQDTTAFFGDSVIRAETNRDNEFVQFYFNRVSGGFGVTVWGPQQPSKVKRGPTKSDGDAENPFLLREIASDEGVCQSADKKF
jgi:hypothetical protein